MSAIAWLAQPPEIRPEWQARTPERPASQRNQRMRARMNVVQDMLERRGPLSPAQISTSLNTTVSTIYATAYAMEDDGRVLILRHPVNGRPDVGQLLTLPWHTDEEIEEAKIAAEAHVHRARSEAGKRRAGLVRKQIQARDLEAMRNRVQREGEVAWVDMMRTTVPTREAMAGLVKALQDEGCVRVERRQARSGRGSPGRWLVWVGE